jgi:hypothetical protein
MAAATHAPGVPRQQKPQLTYSSKIHIVIACNESWQTITPRSIAFYETSYGTAGMTCTYKKEVKPCVVIPLYPCGLYAPLIVAQVLSDSCDRSLRRQHPRPGIQSHQLDPGPEAAKHQPGPSLLVEESVGVDRVARCRRWGAGAWRYALIHLPRRAQHRAAITPQRGTAASRLEVGGRREPDARALASKARGSVIQPPAAAATNAAAVCARHAPHVRRPEIARLHACVGYHASQPPRTTHHVQRWVGGWVRQPKHRAQRMEWHSGTCGTRWWTHAGLAPAGNTVVCFSHTTCSRSASPRPV